MSKVTGAPHDWQREEPTQYWALRFVWGVSVGAPGIRPGWGGTVNEIQIQNLQSGQVGTFKYGGAEFGAGIGVGVSKGTSDWATFKTAEPQTLASFNGNVLATNLQIGDLSIVSRINFGIDLDYGSFLANLYHGDSVNISELSSGMGLSIGLSPGVAVLTEVQQGIPRATLWEVIDEYLSNRPDLLECTSYSEQNILVGKWEEAIQDSSNLNEEGGAQFTCSVDGIVTENTPRESSGSGGLTNPDSASSTESGASEFSFTLKVDSGGGDVTIENDDLCRPDQPIGAASVAPDTDRQASGGVGVGADESNGVQDGASTASDENEGNSAFGQGSSYQSDGLHKPRHEIITPYQAPDWHPPMVQQAPLNVSADPIYAPADLRTPDTSRSSHQPTPSHADEDETSFKHIAPDDTGHLKDRDRGEGGREHMHDDHQDTRHVVQQISTEDLLVEIQHQQEAQEAESQQVQADAVRQAGGGGL